MKTDADMPEEIKFEPNDKARELFKKFYSDASAATMEEFFDLWEAEGDPRRAGSMMAHKLVILGARFAVFGAVCGGHKPNIALWMEVCRERAEEAIKDVSEAFAAIETDSNALPDHEGR